jgi:hypothetical protein
MHGHIVPDALKQHPSTLTKEIGAPPRSPDRPRQCPGLPMMSTVPKTAA